MGEERRDIGRNKARERKKGGRERSEEEKDKQKI